MAKIISSLLFIILIGFVVYKSNILPLKITPEASTINSGVTNDYEKISQESQTGQEYQESIDKRYEEYLRNIDEEWSRYREEIEEKWDSYISSTRERWVQYDENKDTRSLVDFENGDMTIETLVEEGEEDINNKVMENTKRTLQTVFSSDNEAQTAVLNDMFEDDSVPVNETNAYSFINKISAPEQYTPLETITGKDGLRRVKYAVTVSMVPNHLQIRAKRYENEIINWSNQYDLSVPFVLAIIHTESYFNPLAKSHANAYGLMQIVPEYAGRETYEYLYNRQYTPPAQYLYDPNNNIMLGTTYLKMLRDIYFSNIDEEEKQIYLITCGYNCGPQRVKSNVLNRVDFRQISENRLFNLLRQRLPDETSDYLEKVTRRNRYWEEAVVF